LLRPLLELTSVTRVIIKILIPWVMCVQQADDQGRELHEVKQMTRAGSPYQAGKCCGDGQGME
jgi:hypothetical protein